MLRVGMRCDAILLRSPHWIDLAYHLGGDVVDRVVKAGVVDTGAEAQSTIG
jgi:hypothetical protein